MEPAATDRREQRALWASTIVIAAVVVLQAPGRIIPETKLDVTLDPIGYLSRALAAWDPVGGLGRVQNQAVGYLFPMGAVSAATRALGIPPWLGQRLWIALVLATGLWGAHRVARAVGIAGPAGRLAAAWAYALAPATLGLAAFQSAGQVPYAVAPLVLVPLLTARPGDDPRRVAARSALWVAAMGGVNGASAFAVLPLVAVWFASRTPGRDRRRLLGWWSAGAIAATLWWLVPLLVSVRYGIRFTTYTEQSAVTTVSQSATEVLRGTGNWLAYVQTDAGRWLPGAWDLVAHRVAVAGSVTVAAAGLWGLARRDAPGRAWLIPSVVLGAAAMGMAYAGPWGGGLSSLAQDLLDGPLVAFRNVHKFAAVVRLPLALGLGHLVAVGLAAAVARARQAEPAERARHRRLAPVAASALAAVGIVAAIVPAGTQLTAPGSFADVPGSWRQAAAWLHRQQQTDPGRALLVPSSSFGEYRWGRPLDEPISALGGVDWAVRDLIPLGGNGSTRVLDALDRAFATGTLPPGTLAVLQRAGVGYLVVRNDLDLVRTGGPRPATVRRVLQGEPRLRLVASFGPVIVDPGTDGRLASPPGAAASEAFRDIDIYRVPDAAARLTAYAAASTAVVSGGPEGLLQLDEELLAGRATVLDVDAAAISGSDAPGGSASPFDTGPRVATDTARRRDVDFGRVRDNVSYTLTSGARSPITGDAPRDRWPAEAPVGLTVATVSGAASLREGPATVTPHLPEEQPFAAFDGNPTTTWTAGGSGAVGGWLEVHLDEAQRLGQITVRVPRPTGLRVSAVRVATDRGSTLVAIGSDGVGRAPLPAGPTRTVRVTIAARRGEARVGPVGLSEVAIEGLAVRRPLVVPGRGADVVSLQRDRQDPVADHRRDEDGALDRVFRWGDRAAVTVSGTASGVAGSDLDALVAGATPTATASSVTATGSSRAGDQPGFAGASAIDGDPQTAWVSAPEAGAPTLTLAWQGDVTVDEIEVDPLVATSGPALDAVTEVEVLVGGRRHRRPLDATGRITFPAVRTDRLVLRFPAASAAPGGDRRVELPAAQPRQVAIGEVVVPALLGREPVVPDRSTPVVLGCGSGPEVRIDGRPAATRADTTVGELLDAAPVPWRACSPVELRPGTHRLVARPGALIADAVDLVPVGSRSIPSPSAARRLVVGRWEREHRTARIGGGGAAIIATSENANAGWRATLAGRTLTAVRVDGWRQGWIVPAGRGGELELTYAPGATQRGGLALGLVALVLLVVAAVARPRRCSAEEATEGKAANWQPPTERTWSAAAVIAVVGGAAFLTGGALVVPTLVLAVAAAVGAGRARGERWLGWMAALTMAGAGALVLAWPGAPLGSSTGAFAPAAQALAVLAVAALGLTLLPIRPAAGSTPSTPGPDGHRER